MILILTSCLPYNALLVTEMRLYMLIYFGVNEKCLLKP